MSTNGNSKINGYFVNSDSDSDSDSNVNDSNAGGHSNSASSTTDNTIPYTNEYREPVPLSPQAQAALIAMVEEQAAAGRAHAASMRARQGSIGSPIQPGSSPRIRVLLPGSAGRSPNMPTYSASIASGRAHGSPTGNALRGGGASTSANPNAGITSQMRDSMRAAEQATIDAQRGVGNYGGGHIPQPVRLDDRTEATIRGMAQEQAASERARSASLIAAQAQAQGNTQVQSQAQAEAQTRAQAQAQAQTAATTATALNPQNGELRHRRNGVSGRHRDIGGLEACLLVHVVGRTLLTKTWTKKPSN